MKAGDRVPIYNTTLGGKTVLEGMATLREMNSRDFSGLESWSVRFDGDTENYDRMIPPGTVPVQPEDFTGSEGDRFGFVIDNPAKADSDTGAEQGAPTGGAGGSRVIRISDLNFRFLQETAKRHKLAFEPVNSAVDCLRLESLGILGEKGAPGEGDGTGGDLVIEAWACPNCGERRVDFLEIDGDDVTCNFCNRVYSINTQPPPTPAADPGKVCPIMHGGNGCYCLEERCAWWTCDAQCAIQTIGDGARVYSRTVER